jgi:hypothetical protein
VEVAFIELVWFACAGQKGGEDEEVEELQSPEEYRKLVQQTKKMVANKATSKSQALLYATKLDRFDCAFHSVFDCTPESLA